MKTNPDFMWDFYTIKLVPYDLHTGENLYLPRVNTTIYDLNLLIFRRSLLWNSLPTSINISQRFPDFKIIQGIPEKFTVHLQCVVDNMSINK